MKHYLLFAGLLCLCLNSKLNAQEPEHHEMNGKRVLIHRDLNTVNFYYGYSLTNALIKFSLGHVANDITYNIVGPLGVTYEHLVTDVVGLGAEIGYQRLLMKEPSYRTDPKTREVFTYTTKWDISTFRAIVRINFHIVHSRRFDAYYLLGVGYRKTMNRFTTDDPTYDGPTTLDPIIPIPLTVKTGFGLRYFFTEHAGLHLELAAGSPVLSGGISFAF